MLKPECDSQEKSRAGDASEASMVVAWGWVSNADHSRLAHDL